MASNDRHEVVHPSFISPESSIVLDVRLGRSSRPMHFPLLCTVHDILEIIRQVHPSNIERGIRIHVTRSGIWLKSKEYLYTYYLDNLEEVSLEKKKTGSEKNNWNILLPNGENFNFPLSATSTARGLAQSLPNKPPGFIMDNIFITVTQAGAEPRKLQLDSLLVKDCDPSNCQLIITTPGISWDQPQTQQKEKIYRTKHLTSDRELTNSSRNTSKSPKSKHRRNKSDTGRLEVNVAPKQKLNQYPAFQDLVNVAKLSQSAITPIGETLEESVVFTTSTHPGSIGGTELRLEILIEAKEEFITILCDNKDKVQALYSVIFDYASIKTSLEDSYGLFHPTQRHRIPSYVTLKSLNIGTGDLFVFKHLSATPKKKRSKASYMGLLPTKRKNYKPGGNNGVGSWFFPRETLSDTPDLRSNRPASSPTPNANILDELKALSYVVELPKLQKFIRWLEEKNVRLTEGIFRISASATVVEEILEKTLRDENFDGRKFRIHEIAGAFKKYLREAQPIIPAKKVSEIFETHTGMSVDKEKLWEIIESFPSATKGILAVLIPFVNGIASCKATNLMGTDNLAIIFSPILLNDNSTVLDLSKTGTQVDITEQIIQFSDKFLEFLPPGVAAENVEAEKKEVLEMVIGDNIEYKETPPNPTNKKITADTRLREIENRLASDSTPLQSTAIHSLHIELEDTEMQNLLHEATKEDLLDLIRLLTHAASSCIPQTHIKISDNK